MPKHRDGGALAAQRWGRRGQDRKNPCSPHKKPNIVLVTCGTATLSNKKI